MPDPDSLYQPAGESSFIPTGLTRGPWSKDAQHGGPVAALLTHVIETSTLAAPFAVTRLTVELLRPVPLSELRGTAKLVRPGKRVRLVEARLRSDEEEVARATALAIRTEDKPLFDAIVPAAAPPRPTQAAHPGWRTDGPVFWEAMEIRSESDPTDDAGPGTAWFRLKVPVVAGWESTPLQRAAAAADFGNGISAVLDYGRFVYINPDLTLYLYRRPVGEWICLSAKTFADPSGTGLAESALFDDAGRLGRSLQSLYIANQ